VNWKTDLQLSDLDAGTQLEITCKKCGLTRYEVQEQLIAKSGMAQAFLNEVEAALRCSNRFCRGPVRLSLIHDDKTEGFVGGMA
jgi:ribosomal protein L37E